MTQIVIRIVGLHYVQVEVTLTLDQHQRNSLQTLSVNHCPKAMEVKGLKLGWTWTSPKTTNSQPLSIPRNSYSSPTSTSGAFTNGSKRAIHACKSYSTHQWQRRLH